MAKPDWLVFLTATVLLVACHKAEDEEGTHLVKVAVKVAKAETGTLQHAVKAPASVFPRRQANVSAAIPSPLLEVRVRKGDDVKAGQVLAILDSRNLGLYTQTWEELEEQRVSNQAIVSKTVADLAQLDPAKDPSKVESVRSHLKSWQVQLDHTVGMLHLLEIRSMFDGTITEQFQYPGDMAKPENPAFTIMDLSVVTARAQVPQGQLGDVKHGAECQFVPADGNPAPVSGRVTMINKAVDTQRQTVEVWCEITNHGKKLRASTFGEVSIVIGRSTAVTVPESAVQFNLGAHNGFVMVVDAKNIAHRREVEASAPQGGRVQIEKGLKDGETVVTEGGYGLPDGAAVTLER